MLIDQLFPNDVITESAYGAEAGLEVFKQLIQAYKDQKQIDLKVGPEQFPVRYDEARYLLSLWRASENKGKTAELFGNVNWIQDQLEDRDYRMSGKKLNDLDIERAKEIEREKVLNLEGDCECGADKEKETEFHKKLDDLVHSTFGKRKDESVEEDVETYTDSEIERAIRIANHMSGDMTDAYQAIEALHKGLGDHPKVKDALKQANESVEEGVEDIKPSNEDERQILNMLRVFFDDREGYQDAVAIDALDYLHSKGLLKDFTNSLPYFDIDYEEFLDSYPKDWLEKRFGITEDSDVHVPPATRDYITKTIAGKIKPGLDPDGEEFEKEAYLYHTSELGKRDLMAKGGNWKAYYDAIKWWYKNTNESVNENPVAKFIGQYVAGKAIDKGVDLLKKKFSEAYKGWTYDSEIIDYDDNRKISHYATKDGKKVDMDWSPYSTPSEEDFALWVDLGMPTRKAVNGIGPLNIDDLIQLAKDKPEVTHSLLVKEEDKEAVDQDKLDAKTRIALKKAGLKYGAQTKGDPLAALTTFVADKDSEKTQDIDRLDQENDEEEKDIAQQAQVDKKHDNAIGNNSLKDRYQDQEIEQLKQAIQKLLAR